MSNLDKQADELLADAYVVGSEPTLSEHYRRGLYRTAPAWLLVRRLIEPPTDAKLREIQDAWPIQEGPGGSFNFLRFAFDYTPTPEPTWNAISATLRAAGHEAMAVKVEAGR